jgi:RNA polymerase sigma-B factor
MTEPDRGHQAAVGHQPAAHDQAVYDAEDERVWALLEQMNAMTAGDPRRERIRAEIVEICAPLARSVARRYAGRGEPHDDIEQSAMLGLVKAINRFDPAVGDRFLAYAMPTMTGEVKRYFRDRTWRIRVPRELQERRILLRAATRDFTAAHARSPTVLELAEILDLAEEEVVEMIAASEAYQPMSLDTPVHDDENDSVSMSDLIGDPDDGDLDLVVDKLALRPLLDQLPDRERGILLLRFYGNQTQAQISEATGISQMHISRLLRRSLDQLRTALLTDP